MELATYAVLVQGSNEYYQDSLLHISESNNHVSLNSLGLPFVQLKAIGSAARRAIAGGDHRAAALYLDSDFLHSLNFGHSFDRGSLQTGEYQTQMMAGRGTYYVADRDEIRTGLRNRRSAYVPARR